MAKKNPKRPRDTNQLAKVITDIATGQSGEEKKPRKLSDKQSKGGVKGAKSRNTNLTPKQRSEIAKIAANARWKKSD